MRRYMGDLLSLKFKTLPNHKLQVKGQTATWKKKETSPNPPTST